MSAWPLQIPAVLRPDESAALVAVAEAAGFDPSPIVGAIVGPAGFIITAGRDNQRAAVEDDALAALIWARVRGPVSAVAPDALGLNPRLRFYAYDPGQSFPAHIDGAYILPHQASRWTLMLYCTDGFEGGQTEFPELSVCVTPRVGDALVFPHGLWHAGLPVRSGRKIVLRTDILAIRSAEG